MPPDTLTCRPRVCPESGQEGWEYGPCPGQAWVQAGRQVSPWVRQQDAMHRMGGWSSKKGVHEVDQVGRMVVGGTGAGRFLGGGAQAARTEPC